MTDEEADVVVNSIQLSDRSDNGDIRPDVSEKIRHLNPGKSQKAASQHFSRTLQPAVVRDGTLKPGAFKAQASTGAAVAVAPYDRRSGW